MDEYIAKESFSKFLEKKSETECQECTDIECLACVEQWILGQPAADVAPVVHGRWIIKGHAIICSVCSEPYFYQANKYHKYQYCPECGAKMDLEVDYG